jgi:hypothetical protein
MHVEGLYAASDLPEEPSAFEALHECVVRLRLAR